MKSKNIFGIVALFLVAMIPFASAVVCTNVNDNEAEPLLDKIVSNDEVNTYIVTKNTGNEWSYYGDDQKAKIYSPTTTQFLEKLKFCNLDLRTLGLDKIYIEKGYRDEALRGDGLTHEVSGKSVEFHTLYNDAPANAGGTQYSFLNRMSYINLALNGNYLMSILGNMNLHFTGFASNPTVIGRLNAFLSGTYSVGNLQNVTTEHTEQQCTTEEVIGGHFENQCTTIEVSETHTEQQCTTVEVPVTHVEQQCTTEEVCTKYNPQGKCTKWEAQTTCENVSIITYHNETTCVDVPVTTYHNETICVDVWIPTSENVTTCVDVIVPVTAEEYVVTEGSLDDSVNGSIDQTFNGDYNLDFSVLGSGNVTAIGNFENLNINGTVDGDFIALPIE